MATLPNKILQPEDIQMYLRSALVLDAIARTRFPDFIKGGQQIDFDYDDGVEISDYAYSGSNAIGTTTITNDFYNITTPAQASFNYDPLQNKLTKDPTWQKKKAKEIAYQLSRRIDQYGLGVGIDNAFSTITGGALTASGLLDLLTTTDARLTEALAMPGNRFLVMDPYNARLLPQMDVAGGFDLADRALINGMNGYRGRTSAGLEIFISNELPASVPFTLGTNPTAGETITAFGITGTFVANGTATNPGDISIGANVAATRAIVRDFFNGTGTPGASTYIDLTSRNRKILKNTQLTCSAFTGSTATVTSKGNPRTSDTLSAAGDGFGSIALDLLAGVMGALDVTVQAQPMIEELPVSGVGVANLSKNVIGVTQYGAGVFENYKPSLAKITTIVV